ncbi:MAG: flagellar basal body-associated FliL family protein [Pelagimonas sp.]|jgi:hypothetical protein|nr:flagellar basal body-associated FliL family protein [Pelagimonas sp.]
MGKILPLILALLGTGIGVGAGLFLMPAEAPEQVADHPVECAPSDAAHIETAAPKVEDPADVEYVKLNNQFVIPVVGTEKVESLVVASLSVEVVNGSSETVYSREPKLRDVFLQTLFDHANIGGFQGNFTHGERMEQLRRALLEAATPILGPIVSDVLITEIARQDV